MESSAIKSGALVSLQDLHQSSPFFKQGASLRVTGNTVAVMALLLVARWTLQQYHWKGQLRHGKGVGGCDSYILLKELTKMLEVDREQLGPPPDQLHQQQPEQSSGPSTQSLPSAHSGLSPVFEYCQRTLARMTPHLCLRARLQEYSVETAIAIVVDGNAKLKINTQHLRDLSFRVGSIYQFIGELLIQPDDEAILQARVGRNVDGIDLNLYHQSLQLLRQFQADHLSTT
uniref:CST complex subunit TEN1 n=1 Tax=Quercus lobata TaxID=97700 RepID=A0A7N2L4Q3_QUELO